MSSSKDGDGNDEHEARVSKLSERHRQLFEKLMDKSAPHAPGRPAEAAADEPHVHDAHTPGWPHAHGSHAHESPHEHARHGPGTERTPPPWPGTSGHAAGPAHGVPGMGGPWGAPGHPLAGMLDALGLMGGGMSGGGMLPVLFQVLGQVAPSGMGMSPFGNPFGLGAHPILGLLALLAQSGQSGLGMPGLGMPGMGMGMSGMGMGMPGLGAHPILGLLALLSQMGTQGAGGLGARPAAQETPPPAPRGVRTTKGLASSPLVTIKPSGSRPPFFCVHAMLGSVFPYHNLALHFDADQPLYGLQARGLDGVDEPETRVEGMARAYIDAIRTVQPRGKGPYYIGGYSFGGLVAYEMARVLSRQGEEIGGLVLLGTTTPPPLTAALSGSVDYVAKYIESALSLATGALAAQQGATSPPSGRGSGLGPQARVLLANQLAALRYTPGAYAGGLDLFVTPDQQMVSPNDATMGWYTRCVGDIDIHVIGGNHLSMIQEPDVRDLAKKLMNCLKGDARHG